MSLRPMSGGDQLPATVSLSTATSSHEASDHAVDADAHSSPDALAVKPLPQLELTPATPAGAIESPSSNQLIAAVPLDNHDLSPWQAASGSDETDEGQRRPVSSSSPTGPGLHQELELATTGMGTTPPSSMLNAISSSAHHSRSPSPPSPPKSTTSCPPAEMRVQLDVPVPLTRCSSGVQRLSSQSSVTADFSETDV